MEPLSQEIQSLMVTDPKAAFPQLIARLNKEREADDKISAQATLGYIAQTMLSLGEIDRAILVAEESLQIGIGLGDETGQAITLQTQLSGWGQLGDIVGMVSTLAIRHDILLALGQTAETDQIKQFMTKLKTKFTPEHFSLIVQNPEEGRQVSLQAVRERFIKTGKDLLALAF